MLIMSTIYDIARVMQALDWGKQNVGSAIIRELKKYKQILRMVVTTRRILCFADTGKRAAVVFSIAVVSRFLCQNSPIACKHAAAGFFK